MAQKLDAIVVGAGLGGLYMLHRLRGAGVRTKILEAGGGIGGTWYWNRYPGARCDIRSVEYSYQFSPALQQEWEWKEQYATQPEILHYIEHVADRFDLRRDILLNTRVASAVFSELNHDWKISTQGGDTFSARFVVLATGCLSVINIPPIKGLNNFAGELYHTGHWPHEPVALADKEVGIIGTGSSGLQTIPIIAPQVKGLTVFQRTPTFTVPAHNRPLEEDEVRNIKAHYDELRAANRETPFHADFAYNPQSAMEVSAEERRRVYDARWEQGGLPFMAAFGDLMVNADANATAREYICGKIRAIVRDPETARKLSPDTVVGCKRLCVDTDYYATFNRDNVRLVDINEEPIVEVLSTGIRTAKGRYDFDMIIIATGFDAMTGAISRISVQGRNGRNLRDAWKDGPKTYLGLAIAGFPNLFSITGPGSPSVLTNMLPSIEHHVNWIADCISYVREHGFVSIEATKESQEAWTEQVNEIAESTLFPRCNSWYLGSNVPGKPRVFMPYIGFPPYAKKCAEVVEQNYEGFAITSG